MNARKLMVAGSTGAVGKTLVEIADGRGLPVVPLVRAKHQGAGATHPRAVIVNYEDVESVTRGLQGGTTVLQLIGTMRKRFKTGDTYETSDVGTTRTLVEAAKRVPTIDHFVLLSSVGAGKPMGAYLKAKARAEQLVLDSGIPFTILRPSAFMGAGHKIPGVFDWATQRLGARRYQPIKVEDLVDALLESGVQRTFVNRVLEGEALWELVAAAKRRQGAAPATAPAPAAQ